MEATIEIKIKDMGVSLTVAEAKEIYGVLSLIFGTPSQVKEFVPYPVIVPQLNPFYYTAPNPYCPSIITCKS